MRNGCGNRCLLSCSYVFCFFFQFWGNTKKKNEKTNCSRFTNESKTWEFVGRKKQSSWNVNEMKWNNSSCLCSRSDWDFFFLIMWHLVKNYELLIKNKRCRSMPANWYGYLVLSAQTHIHNSPENILFNFSLASKKKIISLNMQLLC